MKGLTNHVLMLFFFVSLFSKSTAQPQNPNWIIPPYIVNFSGGFSTSPLPGGITTFEHCNGAFDDNNQLLFFVVDDFVYDNAGNALITPLTIKGKEIAIVDVPETCDQYYIIYQNTPTFAYSELYYSVIDMSSGSPQFVGGKTNVQYGTGGYEVSSIAISQNFNGKERYLYIGGPQKVDKYRINASNISFDQNILPTNNDIDGYNFEMDLSHDSKKLTITKRQLFNNELLIVALDGSGNYLSQTAYTFPNNATIYGAEFVPAGGKIFVSAAKNFPDPVNGIYEIDFNGANTPQIISGTASYSQSAIELGFDGLLYVASQNDLASLHPTNHTLTPNLLNASFGGFPNLPDQIDGQDYSLFIGQADLVVTDDSGDLGNEPNNDSPSIWGGAVWNCKDNQTCQTDESPVYRNFNPTNYMHVRIKNMGCRTSQPAEAHLYWTIARINEVWNHDWVLSSSNEIPPFSGNTAGAEITTTPLIIPPLNPGQSVTLNQGWNPPDPAIFGLGAEPMICYLARIISAEDPMYIEQFGPIPPYVKNNNNVATFNSKLIKVNPIIEVNPLTYVLINNPYDEEVTMDLHLNNRADANELLFTEIGQVQIHLPAALSESVIQRDDQLIGLRPAENDSIFQSERKAANITIRNIVLAPKESSFIGFDFGLNKDATITDTLHYTYVLFRTNSKREEAGTEMIFNLEVAPPKRNIWGWICLIGLILVIGFWFWRRK